MLSLQTISCRSYRLVVVDATFGIDRSVTLKCVSYGSINEVAENSQQFRAGRGKEALRLEQFNFGNDFRFLFKEVYIRFFLTYSHFLRS